ncbi:MAG: hypothetical protein HQL42_09545 [Alphaproteobacteria bacterium]|nr:hypothetical protein [Alphaproteobacteria bacterium]
MSVYSISYDLCKPGQNYSSLHEAIKSYGTWARPLESYWLVVSSKSAVEIRDHLTKHMDSNDKLLVAKLSGEAAWINLAKDVSDWILKNT